MATEESSLVPSASSQADNSEGSAENPGPTAVSPPSLASGSPPQLPPVWAGRQPSPAGHPSNLVTEDDKTMGMLIHLLGMITGFVGVLILWLVKKDQSRFVDHHGKEALNFMISVLIYSLGFMVLTFVVGFLTLGIGFLVMFPVYMLFGLAVLVFEILACMSAYRGEWHRYPLTIRFIRS